jgi:predicted MFS family arabinose efflux permease
MDADTHEAGATTSAPSAKYVRYVLVMLMIVNALAFLDRSIVNVLSQALKADLGLSDTQLGLLGGFAFVLVYSLFALPVARLAERKSRRNVITVCITIWSIMTTLCGFAGSFIHLFLARVGVGMGEAGASPSAHSMIADYVPPAKRASAISIFVFGNPLGLLIGSVLGGLIAQHFSWRIAFLIVGLPGLLIALAFRLTVKEPPRGQFDAAPRAESPPSLIQVLRHMLAKKSFVHMTIAFTLVGGAIAGIAAFLPAFLMRRYGFDFAFTGLVVGGLGGASACIGTLCGGYLTDWAVKRDKRWFAWVPAVMLTISGILFVIGFVQQDWRWMIGILVAPFIIKATHFAPTLAGFHNMAEARMRATVVTLVFIVANVLGGGGGPLLVGVVSDWFAAHAGPGALFAVCPSAAVSTSGACMTPSAYGVTMAMLCAALIYFWSVIHYVLASRHIRRDLLA